MFKANTVHKIELKDRKLGDEWTDWSGNTDSFDSEINESPNIFLTMAAGIVLIFIASIPVGWHLLKPRIEQLPFFIPELAKWSVLAFVVCFFSIILIESLLILKFRKTLFPYRVVEKFLLSLFPK
jgi:hypothetical protein